MPRPSGRGKVLGLDHPGRRLLDAGVDTERFARPPESRLAGNVHRQVLNAVLPGALPPASGPWGEKSIVDNIVADRIAFRPGSRAGRSAGGQAVGDSLDPI